MSVRAASKPRIPMTDGRISSVMRTNVLRLSADTPIRTATARLLDQRQSAAPVLDAAGRLIGILTEKDCFRPALNASYYQQWSGTVADAMSTYVSTMDHDTDIVAAANIFLDRPFRRYPVVQDGELVGMLDRADLLQVFLEYG
ncbi:CBS domain-containing protein [Jannaschia faecimaris]|uniref:CBS domain-containing protein n=1 Tax=Jannaschia faecimaris TaxID=1244108 RepID=A0A1H3SSD7_9RHOB|nr:CBS domain-containing protein [Jannaschia faecimaris]SDZ40588.1 CBS domain-containing protein [Jannaschia faecimaris]